MVIRASTVSEKNNNVIKLKEQLKEFTLFIPKVPPNGEPDAPCDVTVVIKLSGKVMPAFKVSPSSVLIQLAGEPGWFPAVNKYGI